MFTLGRFSNAASRPISARAVSQRIIEFQEKGDKFHSPVLRVSVEKAAKIQDLKTAVIHSGLQRSDRVSFSTLDGSKISPSEELNHLREIPFLMKVEKKEYTINLN